MANIRSSNEIILSSLDFFRVAQPLLDTKPGTVSRDLLVEGPATQISRLYDELNRVSSVQSLRTSIGSDLDKLAQNVGAIRNKGTKSQVSALFTFTTLDTDVSIVAGNTVSASNGVIFQVLNSVVVSSVLASSYKATAAKFRSDLDFVGITDQFAIQEIGRAHV